MSKKDEAMKLALEALVQWETGCGTTEYLAKVENVVPFIREALAEQPSQQCKWPTCQSEEYQQALAEQIKRELVGDQPAQQEPVAFYVYKPALPRGNLGNVSDGDLPWVYDQDPSSGFSARMLVSPVASPPAQRTWVGLTEEETGHWAQDFLDGAKWAEAKLKEKNT